MPQAPDAENKLDLFGIEDLCDRIVQGDTQTLICKEIGISIPSLARWISLDASRSARVFEARQQAARSFAERAESVLSEARNPFGLAKARELAFHYRWQASKASPREFGEKLEIDQRTRFSDMTDEAIEAKIRALAEKRAEDGTGNT